MKNYLFISLLLPCILLSCFNDSLAQSAGLLYGMTQNGGSIQHGVLFNYNPSTGEENVLVNFVVENGDGPQNGALIRGSNGLMYGMTPFGGHNSDDGVLFSYQPVGNVETVLITFYIDYDSLFYAAHPYFGPMQASDGLIYCVTSSGGSPSYGVIVSYDPQTHQGEGRFYFNEADGEFPIGTPVQASDGLLYGMTGAGGYYDRGVLYSFDPVTNQETVLVQFLPGESANCSLIEVGNELLYGALQLGGAYGYGELFSYDINSGIFTKLFDFNNANGAVPNGLLQASNGLLYGLTASGGTFGEGVLYSFDPLTGQQNVCFNFHGNHGAVPRGNVIQAGDGFLYGTTSLGGDFSKGTLFKYNPISGNLNTELSFHDALGENPNGDLLEVNPLISSAGNATADASVAVFPVPNNGKFSVCLKNINCESVSIYNSLGTIVYSHVFHSTSTNEIFTPDLTRYQDGIYSLQVITTDKAISKKILIQK